MMTLGSGIYNTLSYLYLSSSCQSCCGTFKILNIYQEIGNKKSYILINKKKNINSKKKKPNEKQFKRGRGRKERRLEITSLCTEYNFKCIAGVLGYVFQK